MDREFFIAHIVSILLMVASGDKTVVNGGAFQYVHFSADKSKERMSTGIVRMTIFVPSNVCKTSTWCYP